MSGISYRVIDGSQLPNLPPIVGLDVETGRTDRTNLKHPAHSRLRMVQVAIDQRYAYLVISGFDHPRMKQLEHVTCVGQNLQYDWGQLYHHAGIRLTDVWDTMVAQGLIDAAKPDRLGEHSLKALTRHYLNRVRDKEVRNRFFENFSINEEMLLYGAEDAVDVLAIREKQLVELKRWQPSTRVLNLEMRLVPVIAKMIYDGLKVDTETWQNLESLWREELQELYRKLSLILTGSYQRDMFGNARAVVNLNSHVIKKKLLAQFGINVPNTQMETLNDAQVNFKEGSKEREVLAGFVRMAELGKLVSTYGRTWLDWVSPKTGRVHTSIFQAKPKTGRVSSSDPNVTNVPDAPEIRGCFIAEDGNVLIKGDFSQQEARINAFLSGDKKLLDGFAEGIDPYIVIGREMFPSAIVDKGSPYRKISKSIFLGLSYGEGKAKLALQIGCSVVESEAHVKNFKAKFPRIYQFAMDTVSKAEVVGYAETVLGRRRYGNPLEPGFVGKMRNHPMQGCLRFSTRVLTSEGYRAIGSIYKDNSWQRLLVWTGTEWSRFRVLNRGRWELAQIHLKNGIILDCDTRHKVLTVEESGYNWRDYGDLVIGDKIALSPAREMVFGQYPRVDFQYIPEVHNSREVKVGTLDEEFCYVLGYWYGNGSMGFTGNAATITFVVGSVQHGYKVARKRAGRIKKYFERLGLHVSVTKPDGKRCFVLHIYSRGLGELFKSLAVGGTSHTKRVPEFVYSLPLEGRKAFLRGLFDADGYENTKIGATPHLHMCNRDFLQDVWLLFRICGVDGILRTTCGGAYRLDLNGAMLSTCLGIGSYKTVRVNRPAPEFLADDFIESVGKVDCNSSARVLRDRVRRGGRVGVYTMLSYGVPVYDYSEVVSKEPLGIYEDTYTLAVESPLHRFDSEGIISKNSGADMQKLGALILSPKLEPDGAMLINLVHDESLTESPKSCYREVAAVVKNSMLEAANLLVDVPFEVEVVVGDSWGASDYPLD